MIPVIPGTPLRTAGYLVFYSVVAALAIWCVALVSPWQWTLAVGVCVVAVSLGAGLPIRVTVGPVRWRLMCRARNVALCAALLFCLVDVVGFIWFLVDISSWQR